MYSEAFCKVYNEFGWNYFPEAFAGQLLQWMQQQGLQLHRCLDLACGTGVLCRALRDAGLQSRGMDLSEGMIAIARQENPHIPFDIGDMTCYRPGLRFDLITCTGDALNHLPELSMLGQVFANVRELLSPGGWFVFDLLNEQEISTEEPFDLEFSDTVTARFRMVREEGGVCLSICVRENGQISFREEIRERVYDADAVCALLHQAGLQVVSCSHSLIANAPREAATWFITARRGEDKSSE